MSYRELLGFPSPAFHLSAGSPSLHCVHEWFLVAVFFCYGFCNKVPQTGCLRTAEVYWLIVLEAIEVWDQGQQGPVPPETFRELIPPFLFLASGAFLAVFGIPCFYRSVTSVPHPHRSVFSLCLWLCPNSAPPPPVFKDTSHFWLGPNGFIFTLLPLYRPCFYRKSHSEILGVQTSYLLDIEGQNSTPNSSSVLWMETT